MYAIIIILFYIAWGFYYQYKLNNKITWEMVMKEAGVDQVLEVTDEEMINSYMFVINLYLKENFHLPKRKRNEIY